MTHIRAFLIVFFLMLGAPQAFAAEVAYPPGSRIGLVPPAGFVTSKSFFGFEDAGNNVAIMLVALPADAYAELDKTITADALKRQGLTLESRAAVPLSIGKAFLVIGRQEVDNTKIRKWILVAASPALTALVTVQMPEAAKTAYSDDTIRAALQTLAVRSVVPVDEQLGLLPFKVGEFASFRVAGVIPGRAVMLSDAPADAPGPPAATLEPHVLVTVAPGGPAQNTERDAFARDVFATIPNLKEIRVTTSETLRMGGQQGHQIIANARDATTGTALTVVQWLRFGGGAFMQLVGIARAENWKDAYPRFRTVRDGIEPR